MSEGKKETVKKIHGTICCHIHLTKIENMNTNTYRCDRCYELYDIDLSNNPYKMPVAVFPAA